MHDVEGIERATLAAVPPLEQQEGHGWLLPFDPGTVGRCHSAVPLTHEAPPAALLDFVEGRYAAAGLRPVLRVPEVESFDALREQMRASGYGRTKPTLVQVARAAGVLAAATAVVEVELSERPGADWEQVFLGEGFDPVDGASRLAILRRAQASAFAGVRRDGRLLAVGSAGFGHGWCGIHGMRTLPAARRQGLAASLIAALVQEARGRGLTQVFLQVEQGNEVAQSLYRRLGFATAWTYAYWRTV
jgi:N-acetylglutamate synthase